ncbi:ribulose-phosphate 3-epimerase, partial [Rickettsiaceae bacterium]|nr:ribulose-phosphate 3-epimerase [Rickettsiaceae bacterium]
SVNPGFGGQKFMHNQLEKIKNIANLIKNQDIMLAIDGGINETTAKLCKGAGANTLISGSYIFQGDYKERIDSLR